MSEGIHASYSKVGTILVLGVAAVLGTLIYFGGMGKNDDALLAEMYCSSSVSGLSVGSDVTFRGVKVGRVNRVSFLGAVYDVDFANLRTVYIEIAFDTQQLVTYTVAPEMALQRMLKHGLYGKISESGITGLSKINLDMPEEGETAPVTAGDYKWSPINPVIPLAPSMMDSIADTATKIMSEIESIDIQSTWSNINALASNAAEAAKSANGLMKSADAKSDRISDQVLATMADIDDLVNRLKENPSLLIRERESRPLRETR